MKLQRQAAEHALKEAKSHLKTGEIQAARKLYGVVLRGFPQDKEAVAGLIALNKLKERSSRQSPPKEAIDQLLNFYHQQKLQLVFLLAQPLVEQYPNSFVTWNVLGAASKGIGKVDEAETAFNKVVDLKPNYADGYNNLGVVLKAQGKLQKAIEVYQIALSLRHDYAEAYYNLGDALKEDGQLTQSIAAYKKAVVIKPDYIQAYNNLGVALHDLGKFKEAISFYLKVLSIKPDNVNALYNIGNALQDQGNLKKAIAAYCKVIALNPDFAQAFNNMGNALRKQGEVEMAKEAYENALQLRPQNADTYTNMGNALRDQGRIGDAIKVYNQALSIRPDHAEAHNNLGNALQDQGELIKAIEAYKNAICIEPKNEKARSQKLHLQAQICEWASIEEDQNLICDLGVSKEIIAPFSMLSLEDAPERHRIRSISYVKAKCFQSFESAPVKKSIKPEKLRIGYFSPIFHQNPVSILSARIFELHDYNEFEVFIFSYGKLKDDNYSARLKKCNVHIIDVFDMPDRKIAELALKKGIDIAIEFNGLLKAGRVGILSHRPAPIQINYLAYPGTTGAEFIDYIIADETVIPVDQQNYYSENVIYLPSCYMPQDNTRKISSKLTSRLDLGLPEPGFVFCCFNNSFKIGIKEFEIWMRLLRKVSGSVLWLLKTNKWAVENMKSEAMKRGIDPNRLIFAEKLPLDQHLNRLKFADLFLDTFNFNAHTTASDALWAGCPVITKMGKGFAARVAGSLLTTIGLPELIVNSEEEYEALSLSLAVNPEKLNMITTKLNNNRSSSPLFDSVGYTKNLEKAYKQAHWRYSNGLLATGFKVL